MNTTQQRIADYLKAQSNGVINIGASHAQAIINIAHNKDLPVYQSTSFVKMFQWDAKLETYLFLRLIKVNLVLIRTKLEANTTPVEFFIKYECYNNASQLLGLIFTSNACLFD